MVQLKPIQPQSGAPSVFDLYFWADGDDSPVEQFILGLEAVDLTKVITLLERVAMHGLPGNPEKYKKLKGYENVHELKSDHVRLLCFVDGRRIILTEGFMKTKRSTDQKYIDRAERRRLAFLHNHD